MKILYRYNISLRYRNKGKKEYLNLKEVTMIKPVTGWLKLAQYDDKRVISIANLVETTWLVVYPSTMEITYDQVSKFIDTDFKMQF